MFSATAPRKQPPDVVGIVLNCYNPLGIPINQEFSKGDDGFVKPKMYSGLRISTVENIGVSDILYHYYHHHIQYLNLISTEFPHGFPWLPFQTGFFRDSGDSSQKDAGEIPLGCTPWQFPSMGVPLYRWML